MASTGQRIDRWLWFARFLKTRTLSARLIAAGRVRINGQRVVKPSHPVGVGDVLTFPLADRIRVVRVLAAGTRRGPFAEASQLYEDLSPPPAAEAEQVEGKPPERARGSGRPTKKQRRDLEDWLESSS